MSTSKRSTALLRDQRRMKGLDQNTGLPLRNAGPRRFDNFHARLTATMPNATADQPRGMKLEKTETAVDVHHATPTRLPQATVLSPAQLAAKATAARRDAVMSSPHASGRQRTAMALLNAKECWSTEQILGCLPTMQTDAQVDAKLRREASDAVWTKARGGIDPKATTSEPTARPETNGSPNRGGASIERVWERAYANVASNAVTSGSKGDASKGSLETIWDRAYARFDLNRRVAA